MSDFKVGDRVICLPGFTQSDNGPDRGGDGYKVGKNFIILRFSNCNGYEIAWPLDGGNGIYTQAIKLYNEQPNYEVY
jgi:hypothetical protein